MAKIWHDSDKEQPKSERTVVIWNPSIMGGEVLSRCVKVYPNRLWAYMSDLLAIDPSVTKIGDQENLLDNGQEGAAKVKAALDSLKVREYLQVTEIKLEKVGFVFDPNNPPPDTIVTESNEPLAI